jgi:tetratricopeptide (TPR) repeat protein
MNKSVLIILLFILYNCSPPEKQGLNEEIMASMGSGIKKAYVEAAGGLAKSVSIDSTDIAALMGLADTHITLYIFGFLPREETLPHARRAFLQARQLDSVCTEVKMLEGMLDMLDWKWEEAEEAFQNSIATDPGNLKARHWYSLYLSAMGQFDMAMAQSDTITALDPLGQYLIGRGSLLYFERRNEELKELMLRVVATDTSVAWGYDWLGMAYVELEEYENAIETYYKAFELSDGTVEVGAGLGHALGMAGEYETAKQMARFYALKSVDHYLPPVQRSFIHIGIGEYDQAIRLVEEAYEEKSWFLIFIQSEPWYDPIRDNDRFDQIVTKMNFPD